MRRSAFIGILTGFSWLFLACGSTSGTGGDPDVEVSGEVTTDTGFDLGEVVKRECNGAGECLALLGEPDQCEAVICDELDWTCKKLPVEDGALCSDGKLCTQGDACQAGVCVGGEDVCECMSDEDCAAAEDGDLCNGTLYCEVSSLPFTCEVDPKTVVSCDDAQDTQCAANACDPLSGECLMTPVEDGTPCDDGETCSEDDQCVQGDCVGDDLGCTCHLDADCLAFEDGDLCNGHLYCNDEQLPFKCEQVPGSIIYCGTEQDTDCHKNQCIPSTGNCVMQPVEVGTSCEDGNYCTIDDLCVVDAVTTLGTCVGGGSRDCSDGNVCTNDGCDSATQKCTYEYNNAPCQDNDMCHDGDICHFGFCLGGDEVVTCDDLNGCTIDSCMPLMGCMHEMKSCDDVNVCTVDFCEPATGECYYEPFVCEDDDPCTQDVCDAPEAGCTFPPLDCDDLDPCTDDTCDAETGDCLHASTVCDDANACTDDSCDSAMGGCVFTPLPDDTACDDGFDLTVDDACQAGHCVGTSTEEPTPFRVESVAIEAPILSYDLGDGAVEVNDLLGAYITSRLGPHGDGEAVFTLTPFDLAYPWPTVAFGRGSCLYEEGVAVACAVDPAADFYGEAPSSYSQDEACSDEPAVAAPCFAGDPIADAALGIGLLDLEALEAWTVASFTGDPLDGIDGYLMAFVTKTWIDQLVIEDAEATFSFQAADALADVAPELLDEVEGYWFRLRLNGRQVLPMGTACDDGDVCTEDTYLFAEGACASTPVEDGVPCDDGFASTTDDACLAGVCVGAPAEPPATFRVQDFTIEAPIFTYDLGAGEMELNEIMSAFATAQLGPDGEGDAVFTLAPFDLTYPTPTVTFGGGTCTYFEGAAVSCALAADADYLGEAAATYQVSEACSLDPLVEAPCYTGAPVEDVSMDLSFLALEAAQAWTVASFTGEGAQGISGYLMAFVSKAYLDELSIANADFDFKAGEALAGVETTLLGDLEGYWFRLRFNAERVLPAPEACDDGMPCTADAYDLIEGACTHVDLPDGEICDDGLDETVGDQCVAGACVGEIPPPPAGFRLSTLTIDAPPLCLDLAQIGECTDVTALINGLIGAALDDAEAPTDLLGIFTPFVFGGEGATLSFSNAACARSAEGMIESCWLPDGATPATSDDLTLSDVDACSDVLPAPCYTSTAPSMALDVMGLPFALVGVETSGGFSPELDAIAVGTITGLLPKAYAMQVGWAFGDTVFTLADALANEPIEEQGGITGWTLSLSYSALRVPLIDPLLP